MTTDEKPMTVDALIENTRDAWYLGQTYWQQVDSESYAANKRSDLTLEKFNKLLETSLADIEQYGKEQYARGVNDAWPAGRGSGEPVDDDWEVRSDGKRVRKDRWQWAIRRIVASMWGNRREFEVDEIVDAVRKLIPKPQEDAESLVDFIHDGYAAPQPREPLTDEQIDSAIAEHVDPIATYGRLVAFARAIERAHNIRSAG